MRERWKKLAYIILSRPEIHFNSFWSSKSFPISFWELPLAIKIVAQTVRRLLKMRETQVRSLGWEDPLKKEIATHSSTLAKKTPLMEDPGGLQSMGLQSRTRLSDFSSVQLLSRVRLFATPWIAARQAFLSITNSRRLLKLKPIEWVMPSSHLILCCPLLLLPPIPPSIRVFSNHSTLCMRWPKYWSFSFNISPSNGDPGLISFT